jgi:hypothetical protein
MIRLQKRCITVCNLETYKKGQEYLSLSPAERSRWIPPARENLSTPESFLTAIGRNMQQYSSKFSKYEDLFNASCLKDLKASDRKYLLSCLEFYKRGMNLPKALVKTRPNRRKNKI